MSAKSMQEQGAKTYEKFLKKLLKSPQDIPALTKKMGLSPGVVRKLAARAAHDGKAVLVKKGNAFTYAKAVAPKTMAEELLP